MISKQQVQSAKKKLGVFLQREIERAHPPLTPKLSTWFVSDLPIELFDEVFSFLSPRELAQLGASCWSLYSLSNSFWFPYINSRLSQLDMNPSPSKFMPTKSTFVILQNPQIFELSTLLKKLEEDCFIRIQAKCQIEDLFSRLKIQSPWSTRRVDLELINFSPTPTRYFWRTGLDSIHLSLDIKDGFYKGSCLKFQIISSEEVPTPTVISMNPGLYHPFIDSKDLVQFPLLQEWKPDQHSLPDAILEIEKLFLDQSFLTCYCNC